MYYHHNYHVHKLWLHEKYGTEISACKSNGVINYLCHYVAWCCQYCTGNNSTDSTVVQNICSVLLQALLTPADDPWYMVITTDTNHFFPFPTYAFPHYLSRNPTWNAFTKSTNPMFMFLTDELQIKLSHIPNDVDKRKQIETYRVHIIGKVT